MVHTFKPSDPDRKFLADVAALLKKYNALLADSKKKVDAAKDQISKWLKEERKLDLGSLGIGDLVLIDGVLQVEIGKMSKFDESGFQIAEPSLHEKWLKDIPVKKFKALS